MNPLFKELSANDAKDLLNYLLMQLHEELNLYEEKNALEENEPNFNPYNEQMALENFVKSFFVKPCDAVVFIVRRYTANFIANCAANKISRSARRVNFLCKFKFCHELITL